MHAYVTELYEWVSERLLQWLRMTLAQYMLNNQTALFAAAITLFLVVLLDSVRHQLLELTRKALVAGIRAAMALFFILVRYGIAAFIAYQLYPIILKMMEDSLVTKDTSLDTHL